MYSDVKWTNDGYCDDVLPDGSLSECNPDHNQCCSFGNCDSEQNCIGRNGIDYSIVKDIRMSNESCVLSNLNGFLKHICFDEIKYQHFFKCVYDDTKYTISWWPVGYLINSVSAVCENDIYSYQVCGFTDKVTNTDVLCGGLFCNKMEGWGYKMKQCDQNCRKRQGFCGSPTTAPAPWSYSITSSASTPVDLNPFHTTHFNPWFNADYSGLCNDQCDGEFCEDEAFCNGYQYGLSCRQGRTFVPVNQLCDGVVTDLCNPKFNGRDEENCTPTPDTTYTCIHFARKTFYNQEAVVPIFNYTRCSVIDSRSSQFKMYPYCLDFTDQTNCTDQERIGGYCLVNGFVSNVSKYVVCDYKYISKLLSSGTKLCHDNLEKQCYVPSITDRSCRVHKHRMCNGVPDCIDGSDENDAICFHIIRGFSCQRWFFPNTTIGFPYKWVMDGTRDCFEGDDENDDFWLICNYKNRSEASKRKRKENEGCNNVFMCPLETKFVEQEELCDGVESCDPEMNVETKICRIARDFPSHPTSVSVEDDGLEYCESLSTRGPISCSYKEFEGFWAENQVFGANIPRTGMYFPTAKVECNDIFGEYYVYYSCMGLCLEPEAICPLNDKLLLHDSCDKGQFLDRILTVANRSYITFVRKKGLDYYHENYFQCENGKCVPRMEVCDLVDNCGDLSDEKNCANHVVCRDTFNSSKKHLISRGQKCDGIYDCFDLSDECNESCGREILGSRFLKITCWIMGILAFFLNLFSLVNGFNDDKVSNSNEAFLTNAFISVIKSGDLLIGMYLLLLSVCDSIIFGKDFCREQASWLTGYACSLLGIISTIGSQLSVFTMTVLSINRAWGILGRKITLPSEASYKTVLKTIFSVSVVVLASVTVAVAPLLPELEEYFVQGMYYDPNYKVFIGFPNKARHINVLKEYFNDSDHAQSITANMTWWEIGENVDRMFTDDYGTVNRRTVHFYGNDGICLYKYFVLTDDARRSRQSVEGVTDITEHKGDPIVWFMLGMNFFCFVCIAISYAMIYLTTRKSSEQSNSCQNPAVREKNRELELKVTILVATDFLCWVPFIIISGLHNLKVLDASSWYIALSTLLLPLNSVINPLIYDKYMEAAMKKFLGKLVNVIANRGRVVPIHQAEEAGAINLELEDMRVPPKNHESVEKT